MNRLPLLLLPLVLLVAGGCAGTYGGGVVYEETYYDDYYYDGYHDEAVVVRRPHYLAVRTHDGYLRPWGGVYYGGRGRVGVYRDGGRLYAYAGDHRRRLRPLPADAVSVAWVPYDRLDSRYRRGLRDRQRSFADGVAEPLPRSSRVDRGLRYERDARPARSYAPPPRADRRPSIGDRASPSRVRSSDRGGSFADGVGRPSRSASPPPRRSSAGSAGSAGSRGGSIADGVARERRRR